MPINAISEDAWSEIMKIQSEAYSEVEPESLEVLKSKWLRSPESCFVYTKSGKVVGYLLAHSWNRDTPPKLFQTLPVGTEGRILFLHDLAISIAAVGDGLGTTMVTHLLKVAKMAGVQQIRLVSVQGAMEFWRMQGFSSVGNQKVPHSYGEGAELMKQVLWA